MILTPLQKLPKNGGDWGKLIVSKGFKRLPKVQNIAQSGNTGHNAPHLLLWHVGSGWLVALLQRERGFSVFAETLNILQQI